LVMVMVSTLPLGSRAGSGTMGRLSVPGVTSGIPLAGP
jgi:hypothetical protein